MLTPSLDPRRSLTVTPPFSDLGRLHRHDGMRLTSMEQAAQGNVPRQPISGVGRIRLSWIFSSFSGIRHVLAVAFLGYG